MNVPTIEKSNIISSYVIDVKQPDITGISETMAQHNGSEQLFNMKGQAVQGTLRPGIYVKQGGRKFIVK